MINLVCPYCGCFSYDLNAPRTYKCPKCSKTVEYVEPKKEKVKKVEPEKFVEFNLKEDDNIIVED